MIHTKRSRPLLFSNNWGLHRTSRASFFKQVVLTKSIPFAIENQNIDMEQLLKLRKIKSQSAAVTPRENDQADSDLLMDDHEALFDELNALLGESDQAP